MITIAPTELQIPRLYNEYGILAHSNTYAIDYGRITGLVKAETATDRDAQRVEENADLLELSDDELLEEIVRTDAVARNLSRGGIRREERSRALRNTRRGAAARIIAKDRGLAR